MLGQTIQADYIIHVNSFLIECTSFIFYGKWYADSAVFNGSWAPIAQWIELPRPKGKMEVRFLLGAVQSTGNGLVFCFFKYELIDVDNLFIFVMTDVDKI